MNCMYTYWYGSLCILNLLGLIPFMLVVTQGEGVAPLSVSIRLG